MTSNSKGNHKMLNRKKDSNHKTDSHNHKTHNNNKDSKGNKVESKVLHRAVLIQVCLQCLPE